jgi:hypothetical protein
MQPDEKLIYMVEKSNKIMIRLAEDEQVVVYEGNAPKEFMMED